MSILNSVVPGILPPLDPEFRPCILGVRAFRKAVSAAAKKERVLIGVERENGLVSRIDELVFAQGSAEQQQDSIEFIERALKFLLWARGGWKVHYSGPAYIGEELARRYAVKGARAFDADLMGRVYEKKFEVLFVTPDKVPAEKGLSLRLGGHLEGCRIGFDLGASDYKVAAVKDGEVVFSEELPWTPAVESDPSYHYECIKHGIKMAAQHLPRIDAIGGSSAGVIVNNRVMVASLFRSVPVERFNAEVKDIFVRLGKDFSVPCEVMNDGDVTALAGGMSLGYNGFLGVAMGSSQAGGYLDASGNMTGWLSELAFAPVDYSPSAACDEWSGDRGVGVMYFSQQAVNKLALRAGLSFPEKMPLPERLKEVQALMSKGDDRARAIYESIGVYLGYTVPYYEEFYDYKHMLVLGRVTSGPGGDIIMEKAKEVLSKEFPETNSRIALHVPDEKSRRVGQAVAAASLPEIGGK